MIEYFDVVNECDEPTGELITKAEAHAGHILHRCVAVYVFNEEGELYIQEHGSGYLDHSVGGHVSSGEDYLTSALREGEEELGLKDQSLAEVALSVPSDEVFDVQNQAQRINHLFGIYEYTPDESWSFKPNDEVGHIFPQSLESVAKDMQANPGRYTPGFIITFAKYLEIKKSQISFDLDTCKKSWHEL